MKPPRPLPPPTPAERAQARAAAAALRAAFANPATIGRRDTAFIDYGRPRRGERRDMWDNLPGFIRINGHAFQHVLLPGWEYTRAEIKTELIPDLEALAERGERPTEATAAPKLEPIEARP